MKSEIDKFIAVLPTLLRKSRERYLAGSRRSMKLFVKDRFFGINPKKKGV